MKENNQPWYWIPVLNFASGLPYAIILGVSGVIYKSLNIENKDIGVYTSLLYLPWVIKPLWSPFIDLYATKRKWFLAMQLLISIAFLLIGLTIPMSSFLHLSLAIFFVAAFASASNDVASDGYYMLILAKEQQSFFLGIRSTFYRIANLTGNGLVIILGGYLESLYTDKQKAWSYTMIIVSIFMIVITIYNYYFTPNTEVSSLEKTTYSSSKSNFLLVFKSFFQKKNIILILSFILLFRLGESQLLKMLNPFLVDPNKYEKYNSNLNLNQKEAFDLFNSKIENREGFSKSEKDFLYNYLPISGVMQNGNEILDLNNSTEKQTEDFKASLKIRENVIDEMILNDGDLDSISKKGMGLTNIDYGIIYGVFGVISLVLGGIIASFLISRDGLGKWMLPMILLMHLPIFGFVFLSHFHPETMLDINLPHILYNLDTFSFRFASSPFSFNPYILFSIIGEQLGYGFGFTAFMMYLIHVADGEFKTSHYSIATGFMALGMMLPGMASGFIQEYLGYGNFFIWVLLATIPGLVLSFYLDYPKELGKKVSK